MRIRQGYPLCPGNLKKGLYTDNICVIWELVRGEELQVPVQTGFRIYSLRSAGVSYAHCSMQTSYSTFIFYCKETLITAIKQKKEITCTSDGKEESMVS